MQLPDIDFATADPQEIELYVISTVEKILGRKLERADPLRIFLQAIVLLIIHLRLLIDETAKQNLLAYATGSRLDHLGLLVGCERLAASAAVATVTVTLSTTREVATTINKGTRITAGDGRYFALVDDVIFLAGEVEKTAQVRCLETGEAGNGYSVGELNQIVDVQPFLLSASNITTSEGGSDVEDDEHFRERIRLAPEAYSCAGSEGAYIFHAKSTSALIADVAVSSVPKSGVVDVFVLLNDGDLPDTELLNAVESKLSAKTVRPLTEQVAVHKPDVINYDISLQYWISREDVTLAAQIQKNAAQAVADFVTWQKSKLGRDLNPTELFYRLRAAGVKRIELADLTFKFINYNEVAIAQNVTATFAGLED